MTAVLPEPTETIYFHRAGMDNTEVGKQKKDDSKDLVRRSFECLMADNDKAYVGIFKKRIMSITSECTSEAIGAAMHRKLSESKAEVPSAPSC